MFGGVFRLLLGVCLVIKKIRGIEVRCRCECNSLCFGFSLCLFSSSSILYYIYVQEFSRKWLSPRRCFRFPNFFIGLYNVINFFQYISFSANFLFW